MSGKEKKTVKTVIDGKDYAFPQGTTIFEAAKSVGIEIPHFCYHPGLSIAGACRMCLVEIEKMPKLQISCHMTVDDGMVIHTNNERVKKARKAILEFHLVNHPLDCPVCDQGGECSLQIYYMMHGNYISRLRENKVKKTKKAFQIGPHVMLDQERCVLCSRCVRFCQEISKSNELGIFQRGDREEIDVFPDMQLNSPYSANVVDICPVGALLDKYSRFKTRAWYLESADSICPRCSRGCNIEIHYNLNRPWKNEGRRLVRLKPRCNLEVSDWWICDEGRYSFKFIDDDNRIEGPLVRTDGKARNTGFKKALELAAESLRNSVASTDVEIAVLVSPSAANEEFYLLKRVFSEQLPGTRLVFSSATPFEPTEDDILRKKDKNSNTRGAELMGLTPDSAQVWSLSELKDAVLAGEIGALYICYHDITGLPEEFSAGWAEVLERIPLVVYQGTNTCPTSEKAQIIFPAAAFAEREGTMTNFEGRVQIQQKVFEPLSEALPGWQIIQSLGVALGGSYEYESAEEVFADLAKNEPAFAGLSYEKIGSGGFVARGAKA